MPLIPRFQAPLGHIESGQQSLFDPKKSKNVTLFYPPPLSSQTESKKRATSHCFRDTALVIVALVAAGALVFGILGLSNGASYAARHLPDALLKHQATQWILQNLQRALNTVGYGGQIGFAAGGGGVLALVLVGRVMASLCRTSSNHTPPKKPEVKGNKVKAEDLCYWTALTAPKAYLAVPRVSPSTQTIYTKFVFVSDDTDPPVWCLEGQGSPLPSEFNVEMLEYINQGPDLTEGEKTFLSEALKNTANGSKKNKQLSLEEIQSRLVECTDLPTSAPKDGKIEHRICRIEGGDQVDAKGAICKELVLKTTITKPETRGYTYYKHDEKDALSIYTASLEEISRLKEELKEWTQITTSYEHHFFEYFPKQKKDSGSAYRVIYLDDQLRVVATQEGSKRSVKIVRKSELDAVLAPYKNWTKID